MRSLVSCAVFLSGFMAVSAVPAQDFTIDDDGSRISIADRGQPVLAYVYQAQSVAGEGDSQGSTISNYLHPLRGLYGEDVTGDTPSNWSGAPGISWTWTRLGTKDRVIDLANGEGGKRLFERITRQSANSERAIFGLQNVWTSEPDGKAQILENIAFMVGKVDKAQRTIDLTVILQSVSTEIVYLEGSMAGSGLALQLSDQRNGWSITGGQGELNPQADPYLSPWLVCSYRDDRRSTRSGLAVMQDSRNPGFAQPNWLIEAPNRLSAGVSGTVRAELNPGQTLQFRYRFVLYHLGGSKVDMTAQYARFMAESQQRE